MDRRGQTDAGQAAAEKEIAEAIVRTLKERLRVY
jgi:hypothetical protein